MFQERDTQWGVADVPMESGCVCGSPDHCPALLTTADLSSGSWPSQSGTVASLPHRLALACD